MAQNEGSGSSGKSAIINYYNSIREGIKSNPVSSSSDTETIISDIMNTNYIKSILHSSNIFGRDEIDLYNKDYRFGYYNNHKNVSKLKEFLFFTKPDLNIMYRNPTTGEVDVNSMNSDLLSLPYWKDLFDKRKETIAALQDSYNLHSGNDHFNHLLQNSVISNLEIPGLEGTVIESPVNEYGVGFNYRGSSESSDDSFDFSLEFKDTKWLDVYYWFRTYEEYQTLKHHGYIGPWKGYITQRIIHDQFCIYKFMVDEDMETIIYYCKLYGVMPMNLPRDVFSNSEFDNGISYTINFKAAFFEDMNYNILRDFNALSSSFYNSQILDIPIYDSTFGGTDFRPAKAAYIVSENRSDATGGKVYKLKWRGEDTI